MIDDSSRSLRAPALALSLSIICKKKESTIYFSTTPQNCEKCEAHASSRFTTHTIVVLGPKKLDSPGDSQTREKYS